MNRTIFAVAVSCATLITSASATNISALKPGIYEPGPNGCKNGFGASLIEVEGKNFSANESICHTHRIAGKNRYRSICMQTMGGGKTEADFASDPDKTSFDATIIAKTPKTFLMNGQTFHLCEQVK